MSRSNAPQALSVVAVTEIGDIASTVQNIVQFDGKIINFSHNRTWASMPFALSGAFEPDAILLQLSRAHPRVAKCVSALCDLGQARPVEAYRFSDHPDAGLKEVEGLRVGPDVVVVARASCWFVRDGQPIIPILQPRSSELTFNKLGVYVALVRRAFCKGDWADAQIEIVDLGGASSANRAALRLYQESDLPSITDDYLNEFLRTYIEAQAVAATVRKERPARKPKKAKDEASLFPDQE